MRDRDIRSALRARLQAEFRDDDSTLIIDELGLCQGAARIDLAVVNGSLAGFEIKSDRDTLARLPSQTEAYGRVFDYMTLVVGPRHGDRVEPQLPAFWGLEVACIRDGMLRLEEHRPARRNDDVDPLAVARLLWRDEALSLLAANGLDQGLRSKPRKVLWEALAADLDAEDLAQAVRDRLRARTSWRSDRRPSRCDGSLRSSARSSRSQAR